MNAHKLFSDFPKATKEQWKNKAIEDLKGADFNKKLVWKTDEGFDIQPYYTEEDIEGGTKVLSRKDFCKTSSCPWTRYVEIDARDVTNANELAREMAQFGANGFLFRIEDVEYVNFNALLRGLDLTKAEISFSLPFPSVKFAKSYFNFIDKKGVPEEKVRGFLETDILDRKCLKNIDPDICELAEVVRLSLKYPHFKTVVIKSHTFLNAGCNTTQEIAFSLNKMIDYIDLLLNKWLVPKDLLDKVMFNMAIGGDYFFEIAKLRSLRLLLSRVAPLYAGDTSCIRIMSSSSVWSKSALDPNVNMLRNTTEAMAAVLGGCDALLIQPHDKHSGLNSKLSQRVALNVSNLLKDESYFDKVADPSSGSYYIESLTNKLASNALDLARKIEGNSGFVACCMDGSIQEKIHAIKSLKEKEISYRKRVYVGSNKFPDPTETAPLNLCKGYSEGKASAIAPQHATILFEELKNRTLLHGKKTGFIPSVYMACFGDLAMRKARSTFAGEFFGTAGFKILNDAFFDKVETAAEESAKSKADIVVMCSSDDAYVADGVTFAETFRRISKSKLLVLAGYPDSVVEQLKGAGIDEFVHLRSNAINVLTAFQEKFGIEELSCAATSVMQ